MVRQEPGAEQRGQLRPAARRARHRARPVSRRRCRQAFGHFARHYRAQIERAGAQGLNPLVANYGPALIDRAVLDALCRCAATSRSMKSMRAQPGRHAPSELSPTWRASNSAFSWRACSRRRASKRGTPSAWSTRSCAPTTTSGRRRPAGNAGRSGPRLRPALVQAEGGRRRGRGCRRVWCASPACWTASTGGYRATLDGNEQYADVGGGKVAFLSLIAVLLARLRSCGFLAAQLPIGDMRSGEGHARSTGTSANHAGASVNCIEPVVVVQPGS